MAAQIKREVIPGLLIIFSAVIINELSGCLWSVGAIPRGAGLVKCQHGYLPLPAPATTILLEGFLLVGDEEEGERAEWGYFLLLGFKLIHTHTKPLF